MLDELLRWRVRRSSKGYHSKERAEIAAALLLFHVAEEPLYQEERHRPGWRSSHRPRTGRRLADDQRGIFAGGLAWVSSDKVLRNARATHIGRLAPRRVRSARRSNCALSGSGFGVHFPACRKAGQPAYRQRGRPGQSKQVAHAEKHDPVGGDADNRRTRWPTPRPCRCPARSRRIGTIRTWGKPTLPGTTSAMRSRATSISSSTPIARNR